MKLCRHYRLRVCNIEYKDHVDRQSRIELRPDFSRVHEQCLALGNIETAILIVMQTLRRGHETPPRIARIDHRNGEKTVGAGRLDGDESSRHFTRTAFPGQGVKVNWPSVISSPTETGERFARSAPPHATSTRTNATNPATMPRRFMPPSYLISRMTKRLGLVPSPVHSERIVRGFG